MRRARLALFLSALTAACADDRQLVVVVSSDLEVPRELLGVDVTLEDESGRALTSSTFQVGGPGGTGVPFSFGVAPREAGPMVLVVRARGPSLPEAFPAVRRRIESVPAGRSGLAVHLSRSCGVSSCASDATCLDGLCGPAAVTETELVTLDEGTDELSLVCSAGAQRCSADGLRLRTCTALGQPPTEVACPGGTRCDDAIDACTPVETDTRRVQVELTSGGTFGRVVSDPAGILCGLGATSCEADFPRDGSVTLTAEPSATGRFVEWTGDCTGPGGCVLNLSQHRSVGATFAQNDPNMIDLRLQVIGGGQGEIRFSLPPDQPACSNDCTRSFPRGTSVRLEVEPTSTSRFEGWAGACTGFGSCLPDTSQSGSVQARIVANTHAVEFNFDGDGEAELFIATNPICDTGSDPCTLEIPADRATTLTAVPGRNTRVAGFGGLCQASGDTCSFQPTTSGQVSVLLERLPPPLNPFDLNGDGVSDLLVGAPGFGSGNQLPNAGKLYFIAGPVGTAPVGAGSQPAFVGESDDQLGHVFAFPGDLDGDGLADLVVGLPNTNQDTGAVYVLPGRTNFAGGPNPGSAASAKLDGSATGARFGAAVIGLPDQDGDGRPDFAVSAPGRRTVQVYAIRANDPNPVLLATLNGGTLDFDFGASLLGLGDVDQDGFSELAIAAPSATVNSLLFAGAVFVFRGPFGQGNFAANQSWRRVVGTGFEQRLGFRIAGGIDLIGSAEPDLAVTHGTGNGGRQVAVFGNLASSSADLVIDQASAHLQGGPQSSTQFGASLLAAQNLTAGGGPALLVGDPEHEGAGKGAVYVFHQLGTPTTPFLLTAGDCANQTCTENRFGVSLGLAGDIDQDGTPEILVGALWGGGQAGPLGRGRVALFPSGRLRANQLAPTFSLIGEDVQNGRCVGTGAQF